LKLSSYREKRDFFFVHPTVNQVFTFVSTIDEEYKYIAVSARFNHAGLSPQSVERVFEVKVAAMQGLWWRDRRFRHPRKKNVPMLIGAFEISNHSVETVD